MALSNAKPTENIELPRIEDLHLLPQNGAGNGHASAPLTKQAASSQLARMAKYPEPLVAEYRLLTRKKRLKQLSEEEQERLQVVINTIAEIDRADPAAQVWQGKYNELAAELQQIRTDAEAILAARKP